MTLFNTSDPALRTGSAGEETASQVIAEVPDEGFDIVIMNPPFTRAGSDWEGEGRKEDAIKQFRGLDTDLETQKEMSKREKRFTKNTCYHGYAGIASAFAALGDRKLKPGGVLALVLPLSTASGVSWQGFRELLTRDYVDISVLSIAANGRGMAFSSDTGMGECLVVARKSGFAGGETSAKRVHFTSLNRRPPGFAHAAEMANEFAKDRSVRAIEDGPYAGTPLNIGDEQVGEMLSVPIAIDGEPWGAVRLADASLAQTAYALSRSRLWLPGLATSTSLKIAPLGEVGERGLYHRNIAGSSGAPFTKAAARPTATFPALWNHYASRETRILCEPDIELRVRNGMETKAAAVWAKASHVHLNIDYTFGSQPLAVAFTDRKSLGGPVWTNVILDDSRFDFAYAVWGNSTLGLLMYWWHSSRQQSSKARLTVSTVETLPILDLRGLSDKQLVTAESIFDDFRDRELKPAFQADVDPNRELLDRRVVCELLGFEKKIFEAVRLLAAKWCAEPSVHGGKQRA